jgi:phosphoglycerate kinase
MRSLREAVVIDKKVLLWADLDVPIQGGQVADDTRLKKGLATLQYLLDNGARVLLIGHLGRPVGKDPALSLKPVALRLGQLLARTIELKEEIAPAESGVAMLENIRFWEGEEKREEDFAKEVAGLGDLFVNDCFASSHHAGATMLYLPKKLPSYGGLSLEREVAELSKILKEPSHPLVAIIGGAKIETKLPVINHLAKVADSVLVGGKIMFETENVSLPGNVVVAKDNIDGKDIGPQSIEDFSKIIAGASMVVWNGPMGVFEEAKYALGTKSIAQAIAKSSAYSIIGGGDSISALKRLSLIDKIDYVSSGGGAMLEFLAGNKLPGIEALND